MLPVLNWPNDDRNRSGVHWQTVPLNQWAAGRPFVWLDDEITDADRHWVTAHHSQPTLLHRVNPHRGPTDADLAAVRQWLEQFDEAG